MKGKKLLFVLIVFALALSMAAGIHSSHGQGADSTAEPFGSAGVYQVWELQAADPTGINFLRRDFKWDGLQHEEGDPIDPTWYDQGYDLFASWPEIESVVNMRTGRGWGTTYVPGDPYIESANYPPSDLGEWNSAYGYSEWYYNFIIDFLEEAFFIQDHEDPEYVDVPRPFKYLIVENEVNTGNFWAGTTDEYLETRATVYKAVTYFNSYYDEDVKVVDNGIASLIWGVAVIRELYDLDLEDDDVDAVDVPEEGPGYEFANRFLDRRNEGKTDGEVTDDSLAAFLNTYYDNFITLKRVFEVDTNWGVPTFDYMSYHFYDPWDTQEVIINWIKQEMANHGYERPIMNTEGGFFDELRFYESSTGEQLQQLKEDVANDAIKNNVVAFANGVERWTWYPVLHVESGQTVDGRTKGLDIAITTTPLETEGLPAYSTYQLMINKLDGFSYNSEGDDGDPEKISYSDPNVDIYKFIVNGKIVYVAWYNPPDPENTEIEIEIPGTKNITKYDFVNEEVDEDLNVTDGSIILTETPVFVEYNEDTTAPSTPIVIDGGGITFEEDQLYASWSSEENESYISEYQYKITQDAVDGPVVRDWTSIAEDWPLEPNNYVTAEGLNLTVGETYYFTVKAKNVFNLWSEEGYSNGITRITSFTDVPLDHWAYEAIIACLEAGIVQGYDDGTYKPGELVTRDQMAVYIQRSIPDLTEQPADPPFVDVPSDYWASGSIGALANAGIVEGYEGGYYHPEYTVTRDQMAVYLFNALHYMDPNFIEYSGGVIFSDVPQYHWAFGEIGALADAGIVQGYGDGTYHPEYSVSRDQIAVYIYNTFLQDNPDYVYQGLLFFDNTPPVLNPIGDKYVSENNLLQFSISATDPDDNILEYPIPPDLPSGATFSNGTFSWTPTYSQADQYYVTFTVKDSRGDTDSEAITITVYNVNRAPEVGTISPSSGLSEPYEYVTFTTTYSDPDGLGNIKLVHLLINTSVSGSNCFYGYYNLNTNKLYLMNDAGTAWLGGVEPGYGTNYIISNSSAILSITNTVVEKDYQNKTLTVKWRVAFKNSFTGTKNTYLYVKDDSDAHSGWEAKGTWEIN